MQYHSGIELDHVRAEFRQQLERDHATAVCAVLAESDPKVLKTLVARRDHLAANVENFNKGEDNRNKEIEAVLTPEPKPKRQILRRKT